MRHAIRAGKHAPVGQYPIRTPSAVALYPTVLSDFDSIDQAERDAVTWVSRGHVLEVDVPRNS